MTPVESLDLVDEPRVWNGLEEPLYEVVNGQKVELPPMGAFETSLSYVLSVFVNDFAQKQRLGKVVTEMLFRLAASPKLERRPDIAFVSYARWPRGRRVPRTAAWDVIPDLAAEVVSRSNSADDVVIKVREYFRAGVRLVWVIYPTEEQVYIYTSPTEIRVVSRSQELDGGDVLPGFRLPLAELFEEEAGEDDSGQGNPSTPAP